MSIIFNTNIEYIQIQIQNNNNFISDEIRKPKQNSFQVKAIKIFFFVEMYIFFLKKVDFPEKKFSKKYLEAFNVFAYFKFEK